MAAPGEGASFDAAARAFHTAMAQSRDTTGAAAQLASAARNLAAAMAAHAFNRNETFAALDAAAGRLVLTLRETLCPTLPEGRSFALGFKALAADTVATSFVW